MRLRACILGLSILFSSTISLVPKTAHAVTTAYATVQTEAQANQSMTLAPGEEKAVTLSFQNTGASTWSNDGSGYISLYTQEPKYRRSVFDPGSWLSPVQIKRIEQAKVAPGNAATLTLRLRAPQTEGVYKEVFALAAEDRAWIPGGKVTLTINVKKSSEEHAQEEIVSDLTYEGVVVAQTAQKMSMKAGRATAFSLAVKNTGTATWNTLRIIDASEETFTTKGNKISFAHATWSDDRAASISGQTIAPGQTATAQFILQAPKVSGMHERTFLITAENGEPIATLRTTIEIKDGEERIDTNRNKESEGDEEKEEEVAGVEPIMRVGVLIVDEETNWEVLIASHASEVILTDEQGQKLATIPQGTAMRAAYKNGVYEYGSGTAKKTTASPLRFVPTVPNAVLEVTNFDRRITRGTQFANNTFRNVLELRYNAKKDRTWLINELPMEYYLRGLAETSNSSPEEFQKALMTAARTYAYFHYSNPTKHAAEGYHVDAYRDQVYWGYGQEERNPLITAGVEATRGRIVTYEGETAITSYFSRSDGRTRNWSEVWGRNVPYAKSVSVPCDEGKTLWGHGVGMSASGAICMANEGKTWEEILKYFYTGIEITKTWK